MERVIQVSVAVSTAAVRFRAEVRAEGIEEAVRLTAASYPGGEVMPSVRPRCLLRTSWRDALCG